MVFEVRQALSPKAVLLINRLDTLQLESIKNQLHINQLTCYTGQQYSYEPSPHIVS